MTESAQKPDAFEASGTSPPSVTPPATTPAPQTTTSASDDLRAERKRNRTLGLNLFDVFLYPFLTNFVVFGMSVAATYYTSKGDTQGGAIGRMFFRRGQYMESKFQSLGMGAESAKMSKMVFFSFLDGTLIAPLVKIFEDRRERIGKWIDDRLGTTPQNLSVYDAEPKQTWGTVIKGRLATASIVVPTAIAFDKWGVNHRLFNGTGASLGKWIESKPGLAAKFGAKTDIPELAKIGLFEMVYTSICTAGLYFLSRRFAHQHDIAEGRVADAQGKLHVRVSAPQMDSATPVPSSHAPETTVSRVAHESRLQHTTEPELAGTTR